MAGEPIPDDIRDFILRHVDSVAQLEALLLLRGSPDETWEVGKIAKRLYISEPEITEVLARLCEDGFLSVSRGVYRYDCTTNELRALVDRLAATYTRHLIPVTNIIHAKPRRIRQFADAFKLKKDG